MHHQTDLIKIFQEKNEKTAYEYQVEAEIKSSQTYNYIDKDGIIRV